MRGNYAFIRGCMRPEINYTLDNFATTIPPLATFPDIYLDGVPDGTVLGGTIFTAGPGGYYVSLTNFATPITLISPLLTYGVAHTNVILTPLAGTATGIIDTISINYPFSITTFTCTKGSGGPLRRTTMRLFVDFTGVHDNFSIDNSDVFFFDLDGFNLPSTNVTYYGRVTQNLLDPTLFDVTVYSDIGHTIALYSTLNSVQYGQSLYTSLVTYGTTTVVGRIGTDVPIGTPDFNFTVHKHVWNVDEPLVPTDFVDISQYLNGQFTLSSSENEEIINKQISRKLNLSLRNEDNVFDYNVFGPYNPTGSPPNYNGPYDPRVYLETNNLKKIGNIRSGRFVVAQIGVWDESRASWQYIDKFRGRIGDITISRQDRTVQMTLDDESTYFKKIKTEKDIYIYKTFEYIFRDQCMNRLNFGVIAPTLYIDVPTTEQQIPFVYMPDLGETVWDALVKLAESIGGKVDLLENAVIKCRSRMVDGDDQYVWDAMAGEDEARTLNENSMGNIVDTLSSSTLYNQQIINRVTITSKPTIIEQRGAKVWKFKEYYDEDAGKNNGILRYGRFFGDVWVSNTVSYSQTGPIKGIDRSAAFSSAIDNEVAYLEVTRLPSSPTPTPANTCEVSITYGGTSVLGVVPATGGVTAADEFDLGTFFPTLAGCFITMEEVANLSVIGIPVASTENDKAEIQLGIRYYANFGDKFRVMPNRGGFFPIADFLKFFITSSRADAGFEWTDELVASSDDNGGVAGFNDRVVMAMDPTGPALNWDTDNIFYLNSTTGDSMSSVPIILENRDAGGGGRPRYVNSLEIFGRRIVESNEINTDVAASEFMTTTFGGEQLMTIDNNYIPNGEAAAKIGKFIVDNYLTCRDIPKITLKQPRPFYQVGDRVRKIDSLTGLTDYFIINKIEESFNAENYQGTISLRAADAGTGPYDPAASSLSAVVQSVADYTKLAETVDATTGAVSTEIRRDIYMMSGVSYDGRHFDFTTGLYSGAAVAPAGPVGIVESVTGEPRLYDGAPNVIVAPLFIQKLPGALGNSTTGIQAFADRTTLSATSFDGICYADGEGGVQRGWFSWVAIGVTKSTT